MQWPRWWSSSPKDDEAPTPSTTTSLHDIAAAATDAAEATKQKVQTVKVNSQPVASSQLRVFTEPQTIAASVILTATFLACFKFYRVYLRRIPEATNIHPSYFRKRSVFGKVTSVGDGDNFRVFHTPGGWLAGWGWLPWRKVPSDRKMLKNKTIHVRLAGIDAPELAHFGRPSQPFSQDALNWLTSYLAGRRVRAYVHKPDQYGRVVATVYVWKGLIKRDVGLQMLRAGMASVYEAKTGAEFGEGLEQKYRSAEQQAKAKRKGIWSIDMKDYESPREYKNKYAQGAQS